MFKRKIMYRILFIPLILASYLYAALMKTREKLYFWGFFKTTSLKARVISVGNITLGGTGKTPIVQYLAESLRDKGKKVAILSRGYG